MEESVGVYEQSVRRRLILIPESLSRVVVQSRCPGSLSRVAVRNEFDRQPPRNFGLLLLSASMGLGHINSPTLGNQPENHAKMVANHPLRAGTESTNAR